MKRNVKQYAEKGMKRVTGHSDLYSNEIRQLYDIGDMYETITTAFYFGVEVGSRKVNAKKIYITKDTKVSELRTLFEKMDADQRKELIEIVESME